MEATSDDIKAKYQKLAAEYSKLRAQAQVLRKGVVEEQAKRSELTEILKEYEQRVRKTDLEMESLNFRNQQLTKRIGFLQDELDKLSKQKNKNAKSSSNNLSHTNNLANTVIDEELKNKIIENAQLLTTLSDKEVELSMCKEHIRLLQEDIETLQSRGREEKRKNQEELANLQEQITELNAKIICPKSDNKLNGENRSDIISLGSEDAASSTGESQLQEQLLKARQQIILLKQTIEKYESSGLLSNINVSMDSTNQVENNDIEIDDTLGKLTMNSSICDKIQDRERQLSEYFLKRINDLIRDKEMAESIKDNITVEYNALELRLEQSLEDNDNLTERLKTAELTLESLQEELSTTSHNYELQLSTMSEHLANMNDTLAKQSDQIQQYEYNLKYSDKRNK